MAQLVDTALFDVHDALIRETCGVSCPFCRYLFEIDELPSRMFSDKNVVTMVCALQQCNTEMHSNTMNETSAWMESQSEASRIESELDEIHDEVDYLVANIDQHERTLVALRSQRANEKDRQSFAIATEQIDQLTMQREWEWCMIGHLEANVDEKLASYIAHCNIMQLQTVNQSTFVSDLLRTFNPQIDHGDNQLVQKWDEMTSPIGFFTFLPQRIRFMHGLLDAHGFLRYIREWFILRNDLLYLVDDVRRACRKTTRTGLRRWLHRNAGMQESDIASEWETQIRRLFADV